LIVYHVDVIEFVIDNKTMRFWLLLFYLLFFLVKRVNNAIVGFNLLWRVIVSCNFVAKFRHDKIILVVALQLAKHVAIAVRVIIKLIAGCLLQTCKPFLLLSFPLKTFFIGFGLGLALGLLLKIAFFG
jgi:hypothetical protein